MAKKRTKKIPLIVEPHPEDYNGYPFITLLQYRKETHILSIIDNAENNTIKAFVLDLCGPESIDEGLLLEVAHEWFITSSKKYPFSIELSRRGLSSQVFPIYRSYNTEYISRVIGPLPVFDMHSAEKIRRRRKKKNVDGIPVTNNVININR